MRRAVAAEKAVLDSYDYLTSFAAADFAPIVPLEAFELASGRRGRVGGQPVANDFGAGASSAGVRGAHQVF